jgi:carbamoylphosphate synthase large subunit
MLVVPYGSSHENWKTALSHTSSIWDELPHVETVIIVEDFEFPLKQIASKYAETVLIPLKEPAILDHPQGYLTLVPSKEVVNLASYKDTFYNFLADHSFKECFPKPLDAPDFTTPFILKRLHGEGGFGIFLVWNEERYKEVLTQPSLKNEPYILEEYIEGDDEYIFYAVCKQGEILWHASLMGQPPTDSRVQKGSFANASEVEITKEVYNVFKGIFKALNYDGPANFNYKLKNNKPVIFEMNPRIGGTLMDPKFKHLLVNCLKTITLNAYLQEQEII